MKTKWLIPKKFCCAWPLGIGCIIGANLICIAAAVQFILTVIGVLGLQKDKRQASFSWREAYAYLVLAIFYSLTMILTSIWLIWGVVHKKSSVVLCWVVVASLWTAQNVVIMMILLGMYHDEASITAWSVCLVFAIIATGLFVYAILVGFGYYKQLKEEQSIGQIENLRNIRTN